MITTHNQAHLVSHQLQKTKSENALLRSRRRWIAALYFSGVLGLVSGILGLAFCILPYLIPLPAFTEAVHVAPGMLVAAFPLLILAAHSLDKMAELEKRAKLEYISQISSK